MSFENPPYLVSELVECVARPAEDGRRLCDVLRLVGHQRVHERHEGAPERVVDAAVGAGTNMCHQTSQSLILCERG